MGSAVFVTSRNQVVLPSVLPKLSGPSLPYTATPGLHCRAVFSVLLRMVTAILSAVKGKKVGCVKGELAMGCWALGCISGKRTHGEVEAYLPQYLLNTVVQVLGNTPMQPLGGSAF